MRRDIINSFVIFIVILFAGIGLMYASNVMQSDITPTPTPVQTTQNSEAADLKQIKIEDETVGSGKEVKKGDTITVNYTGTLTDGKVFDTSVGKQPFTTQIGVGNVIRGWDLGMIGMKVGGKRKLTIPADLAYGSHSQGGIPANSTLIFEVDLLDVK